MSKVPLPSLALFLFTFVFLVFAIIITNVDSALAQTNPLPTVTPDQLAPTALNGTTISDGSYALKVDGNEYALQYKISGAHIQNMTVDGNTKSLVIALYPSHGEGSLTIKLPRDVIEARGDDNKMDIDYQVFVDDASGDFVEIEKNGKARVLEISFESDAGVIAIKGTHIVPEFSAATMMAMLAAAWVVAVLLGKARFFLHKSTTRSPMGN